ncbi:small ribosomal subunit protein mS37 isoform X2 [Nomia melanderi]|uniref:small ribosomal subunit protein mS37 isoform X2 n=1 Tax=Nomia melanderi TaxID=2448451 RepID=UPI0013047559|nr:coiled-coil-helix-coiled-coil-helix domain-containing protein 1 isoform X2 [Nomia melanderi]
MVSSYRIEKMRQTTALWKRIPQSEKKVPFRAYKPLVLNDYVKGGGSAATEKNCLYEISLLFNCLQDNDFDDKSCGEQIKNFNSCVQNYKQTKCTQKKSRLLKMPEPGSNTYTSGQLTYLLKKYPNI